MGKKTPGKGSGGVARPVVSGMDGPAKVTDKYSGLDKVGNLN